MRAVNLIPAEQRSGQPVGAGRSQGGAYAVLVLIAGIAIMAYSYGSADHQISSRHAQVASLTAQAQQAQAAAERLAPYTSFIALREQRTQAVKALVDSRFDWAHVLHEFGRVLPAQASISSLSGTIGTGTGSASTSSSGASSSAASSSAASSSTASSSAVASSTPPGSVPTFTLAGCATSQTSVALTLERLRLIDGVKEVTLQSSTTGSSGGGSSGGGCPAHDPTFTATVSFDPLPSPAAATTAAKTVSDSTGAPATVAAATTSGVSAR
jgi:Tfp pilus assembly protein PilN